MFKTGMLTRLLSRTGTPSAAFGLLLGVRVLWTLSIQMLLVGIAWHAYEISGTAWSLALIGLYQFLPVLIFSIPAGYLVDRYNRQRLISLCLAVQCLAAAWLAGLSYFAPPEQPYALYAASVLLGLARSTLAPALQAITPALVPTQQLARAMATVSTATQISVIAGPALAGFLIAAGVHWVYCCSAFLMLAAVVLPCLMQVKEGQTLSRKINLTTLFAGFRFIGHHPILFGAILLDLLAVLFGGAVALLPIYVKDILGGGPTELGLLRAAPAAGALLMSVALVLSPLRKRVGPKLMLAIAVFGLSTVIFGLSRSVWLSALALMVNGATDMISVVIRQTLVQLETPDAMRGRVSAVNAVFIGASNQLGEFQAGAVAALLGPITAVVLGGTITAALPFLWKRVFPALSTRNALFSTPSRSHSN